MVSCFIKGLNENGISVCAKHFPGLNGDTIEDSHNGIAVAYHTLEEMEKQSGFLSKKPYNKM